MGKLIDETGNVYGSWTVLKHVCKSKWLCQCKCGKQKIVQRYNLVSGKSISCGCSRIKKLPKEKKLGYVDITNQKFGRLTALYPINVGKNEGIKWHCKCDCGNECDVRGVSLRRGDTMSCGCFQRDNTSKQNKKSLVGKRFGLLTVIEEIPERTQTRKVLYKCKCDCGNYRVVKGNSLTTGNTMSCGCLSMSHGELKISQLLTNNNIEFIQEYNPHAKDLFVGASYDFYLPKYKTLVEYDGRQHFDQNAGWNEELEDIQRRDGLKNQWALKHGYTIIRIPYTQYKDLSIEDLMPETSTFIYTETS